MKRGWQGVAAVAVAAFALLAAGCGGGGSAETSFSKSPDEVSGSITVPATVGVNEPIIRALAPQFMDKYPIIKVNVVGINYLNVYERQLVDLKSKKGGLDLLTHTPSFFSIYVANGYLQPLQPLIDSDLTDDATLDMADFPKSLVEEANSYDGELYGLPFIEFPVAYIYRKDLFAEKGIAVPKTLDEMMAVSKKLNDPPTIYGNTVQGTVGGAGANTWNWYPFLFSFGGEILDSDGKPQINSPEAVKALQYYVDLYKCCSPKESVNWDNSAPYEPILGGKLASLVTDADTYPQVSKGKYEIGIAPMPAGPGGSHPLAGSWSYSISKYSKNKEAAWLFMQFIASKGAMPEYIKAGGIPPRLSTLNEGDNPLFKVVATSLEDAKGLPKVPNYLEMEDAIGRAIADALLDKASPQEALDGAQSELEKLVG
jgi:ABC-type glycerol-3-phosphate transport system substrate-binding protein